VLREGTELACQNEMEAGDFNLKIKMAHRWSILPEINHYPKDQILLDPFVSHLWNLWHQKKFKVQQHSMLFQLHQKH